jgi:hypothetical protein|tara:strand:- start:171 stop:548 length:378 start_codon:yes stop_codon:yes gene_type:complete
MHKLTFKSNKTLRSLARETLFAKEFKIAYRDKTTQDRQFWLVKDEGIYVMNCYLKDGKRKVKHVVYASGYNPKYDKNDDLWDRTHAVSGDDFVENIPLDISALIRLRDGGNLTINLGTTDMEIIA